MVQCEMCGAETSSPTTITVEGAELQVCDECTEFGTEVRTEESSTTSTKYSTADSGESNGDASSGGSGGGRRGPDMFDEMDELAADYDQRIRAAREEGGLSQSELADQLNEKASLIRKLERGDVLPSDDIQRKLERALDITLSAGGGEGEAEWDSDNAGDGLTLGDMVKRKD